MILHNPFGPIFEKELRATSRRKRTYALRSVYLAGLLMFLVLAYVSGSSYRGGGVAQRVMQQNQLGQMFFIFFSLFCVGAMTMIGPVLTCTAISAERLHKTLHVLLMTPITSWQIVTGKLFSRLLAALTLIGLSLPVLALVRLLGGVEIEQMFGIIALATATAVVTASLGLFVSTFVNRAYAAILLSYAAILLLWFFVPIIVFVLTAQNGPPPWMALRFVSALSPPFCTAFVVSPVGAMFAIPWAWCVGAQLGVAGVLVTCSALVLRRLQRREGMAARGDASPSEAAPTPITSVLAAEDSAAPPVTNPVAAAKKEHRKTRRRRRDVHDNPVLWRELGRPLFPSKWQSRVAGWLFVALLLVSYASFASAELLDDRELQVCYACGFNVLAWLMLAVLSATAIAQEKESDTWTLLLATPINARAVVWGKVIGLYRRLLWPGLIVAAHFALFVGFGVISWVAALLVMWIIFSFNALWVASGIFLSLRLRKVTFAVIVNLSLALAAYVALPVMLAIMTELTTGPDTWAERLLWGLPYFYLTTGVYELSPEVDLSKTIWQPGTTNYQAMMPLSGLVIKAIQAGAAHLLVAGLIFLGMIYRFNRIVGRAAQREALPPPPLHLSAPATTA